MSADSASISISVSPNVPNTKGGKPNASDDDANAFEVSLEVAREEADGEDAPASITIQGTTGQSDNPGSDGTEGDDVTIAIEISGDGLAEALGVSGGDGSEDAPDVTIEIETVVFSGDDLAQNLSASALLGDASVAVSEDGSFGVSGALSGDAEVQLEVGETLTFELPETEGEVVGGQVTITNLFNDDGESEGALVFAYDADDQLVATYAVLGNDSGTVTVDIDVSFARLDFKAIDNDAFLFEDNSSFGISEIGAIFASVIEDLAEGASQLIDDVIGGASSSVPELADLGHFGAISFELGRITVDQMADIDALSRVSVDLDQETDRHDRNHGEQESAVQSNNADHLRLWHMGDRLAG